jgi:hypothetical protein
MKLAWWILVIGAFNVLPFFLFAQNVGIGIDNPVRGKLEVASPLNNITIAAFGSNGAAGVSIDDNNPLIGFNNYKNVTRKFMGSNIGYASILFFETAIGRLRYNMAGNRGTEGQDLTNFQSFFAIDSNGNVGIGTADPREAKLQIHEPAGNTQFIAAAGSNLPGISAFVPISSPSIGFNVRYQNGYKYMGAGFGSFFQYSPSTGTLSYYSTTSKGVADGSLSGSFGLAIDSTGNLGVNTNAPKTNLHVNGNAVFGSAAILPVAGYRVSVDGKIICEELKVQLSGSWPDYVFENDYPLLPLAHLQQTVLGQKHLPGIPSALQMQEAKGLELGDMQKRMLEKLEEAYLYIFELNEKNQQLEKRLSALERKNQHP